MKNVLVLVFCCCMFKATAQATPPIELEQQMPSVEIDRDFDRKYKRTLRRLRRVYPLALQAKKIMIEFESDMDSLDSKRAKRKLSKQAHQALKDEFTYSIRDLYTSEGILLMKLVHRETGYTVSEIIRTYRGGLQANFYAGMGKLWEQDLDATYDPYGEDWLIELVINDIINKRVQFDWEIEPLNKEQFKQEKKLYRQNKKKARKSKRKLQVEMRRKKRQKKKEDEQ